MYENFLNGLKPGESIFRYMEFEHFIQILEDQKLLFKQPHCWSDPHEEFIEKTILRDNDKGIGVSLGDIRNGVFAQCWTRAGDCDGLWKNFTDFSDNKPSGVMIKVTAEKLFSQVSASDKRNVDTYIGNVV